MNLGKFYNNEWAEHLKVVEATRDELYIPFSRLLRLSVDAISSGNKLLFFGNGGSASDSQHLATELIVRYKRDRAPIAALALTTDTSALTAIGNDLGFNQLFARQIRAVARKGDVAIAISTSGRSPNVLEALKAARELGITAAAFSGHDGGDLPSLADPLLIVPSKTTARIQEMHITIGQMLCNAIEIELGLAEA